MWASRASVAAHSMGRFQEMADKIFNAAPLLTSDNVVDYAEQFAVEIGLDSGQYVEAVKSLRSLGPVVDDITRGQKLGVTGVPEFFINGERLSGAQPLDRFKEVIDFHLGNSTDAQCRLFAL